MVIGLKFFVAFHWTTVIARFVFVFREQAYMQSKNCLTELKALLAKPDGGRRAIVYEYRCV